MARRYSRLACRLRFVPSGWMRLTAREAMRQVVKEDIDDRGGVEGEHLAEEQAANHGDAERPAKFRANSRTERQWDAAEQRSHRGHHNGTETQQAGLIDGIGGVLAMLALGFQREINHHDAVFLHDADKQ